MDDAIQRLLQSTETLLLALPAREPSTDAARVIALVVNRLAPAEALPTLDSGDTGTGCLLILESGNGIANLFVREVIPIVEPFNITMAQQRRGTLNLRPGSLPARSGALTYLALKNDPNQKLDMSLTITRGASPYGNESDDDDDTPRAPPPGSQLELITNDIDRLKQLLSKYKSLMNARSASFQSPEKSWAWLETYYRHLRGRSDAYMPESYYIPPDLRINVSQLHQHLSPCYAGRPANPDAVVEDIETIRSHWVWRKALKQAGASTSKDAASNSKLNIRLCTFNVNGKLPSGDTELRSWVLGQKTVDLQDEGRGVLPPLPDTSPFAVPAFDPMSSTSDPNLVVNSQPTNTPLPPSPTSTVSDTSETLPDMLVFGFQELDLSTAALIYSTPASREEAWTQAIMRALEGVEPYVKVISKQLVGMLIILLVREPLRDCFTELRSTSIGTGVMGILGNKGAVALRVAYSPLLSDTVGVAEKAEGNGTTPSRAQPTILTFVNAHLAAFDEMVDRRNADFHDLSKRLTFDVTVPEPPVAASAPSSKAPSMPASPMQKPKASWPPDDWEQQEIVPNTAILSPLPRTVTASVFDSDALFWIGDLNYRIDLPDAVVRKVLEESAADLSARAENLAFLARYDQLGTARQAGRAFDGLRESLISHYPSYRFSPGEIKDSLGYDVKRKPAWTDRVLYAHAPSIKVKQTTYSVHSDITMSDHRPVSADITVHTPLVDGDSHTDAIRTCYKLVADAEAPRSKPEVHVSHSVIELGTISYKREVVRTLTITNRGKVPCVWRLVTINEEIPLNPEWMTIEPTSDLVLPGEEATITLRVYINDATALKLNIGHRRLEHTIILHTLLGKDHFVAVGGDYLSTCFGNALDTLARIPGPIRALSSAADLLPPDAARSPREIMRLISWLMDHAGSIDELFVKKGDETLIESIREALDTGEEFMVHPDKQSFAYAVATTLATLLGSLSQALIPTSLYSQIAKARDRDDAYQLLSVFPPANVNVWVSLSAFLHYYVRMQADAGVNASILAPSIASVMAPILMKDEDGAAEPATPLDKRRFLLYFITD